jgi:hypothetical protein
MIVTIANDYEIPPLLLYALIRQESMFNPFISSTAGASGLSQIMPATGAENVDLLNWPDNYDQRDLLLGKVNLTLGAFYLDRMRTYLSGNTQAALAAYNAGPGNAETWLALSIAIRPISEILRAKRHRTTSCRSRNFLIYTNWCMPGLNKIKNPPTKAAGFSFNVTCPIFWAHYFNLPEQQTRRATGLRKGEQQRNSVR